MMAWGLINIATSLFVVLVVVYKLAAYPDRYNPVEKVGMGVIGSSMLMLIGPILAKYQLVADVHTPFDDWAGVLLRMGCAVYFLGRLGRFEWQYAGIGYSLFHSETPS